MNLRLSVGLDVDDTLMDLNRHAVALANEDFGLNLSIEDVKGWDCKGKAAVIRNYYSSLRLYSMQRPNPGSQEFVRELCKICDVYIVTAVRTELIPFRAQQLRDFYPEVPESHYIFTSVKSNVTLDILLDDAGHNILDSEATFPVLMKRPWNRHISGMLAVKDYDEFMAFIKQLRKSFLSEPVSVKEPTVFALVGPSGSGKTAILNRLLADDRFAKQITYTSRPKRADDKSGAYYYVSEEEFLHMRDNGEFAEWTTYAGNYYGSKLSDIQGILQAGQHCAIALDISGAIGLKSKLDNVVICFIRRSREDMIRSIVNRNCDPDDKVTRILSIENELKNKQISDIIVNNRHDLDSAVNQILGLLC